MSEHKGKSFDALERLSRFRLAQSENVGPITFRQLIARYKTAGAALAALPELARRGGYRKPITIFPKSETEDIFARIADLGASFLFLGDGLYPEPLAAIEDAPPYLVAKGHHHLLTKKIIAIVGARNASANGQRMAQEIAHALGAAGYVIASGLARGIDTHAHLGSLASGTVAVLGGGIDVYYPKENRDLQDRIAAQGLVLTEHLPGAQPQAQNFPRRNRVISGLSVGVVVVEAALRSGSLITARLALEQGREVFAVPGHPMDPRARGPNALIRSSALLVESADDILEAFNTALKRPLSDPTRDLFDGLDEPEPAPQNLAEVRKKVLRLLGPAPTLVDDLVHQNAFSPAALLTVLLELELAGEVKRHPGNKVSLT